MPVQSGRSEQASTDRIASSGARGSIRTLGDVRVIVDSGELELAVSRLRSVGMDPSDFSVSVEVPLANRLARGDAIQPDYVVCIGRDGGMTQRIAGGPQWYWLYTFEYLLDRGDFD